MTIRTQLLAVAQNENLNFLLTNRLPRRLATGFIGWISRKKHPLIRTPSMALWRMFADLDLSDARKTRFDSLHDCFVRELKEGARPVVRDTGIMVSPCDAIVGAMDDVADDRLFQVKGFPYTLRELFDDDEFVATHRNGRFVTLRLTSSMYHRFHAPHDCTVERTSYISGDTWNVNPIALKRVEKLFCKNERAVVRTKLEATGDVVTLVPVAAILVASIHLNWLDHSSVRHPFAESGESSPAYRKGDEMGRFEHGSTIIVFVPRHFEFCTGIATGANIRMGEALFRIDAAGRHMASSA